MFKGWGLVLFWLFYSLLLGAEAEFEIPEKSQRYHQLLLKRPDSKALFERFFNS